MKKLLALLLAGAMLFALAACGGTSSSSSGSSDAESGSSPSGPDSSAASDSSESDAEAGRWDALRTTDEPVQLSFELNSFMPTINTEPTEEAPLVRVAPRKVLEEWLEDKPNVKADWNFRNRDGNDDEWLTIQFTAKTAPDLIEQGPGGRLVYPAGRRAGQSELL